MTVTPGSMRLYFKQFGKKKNTLLNLLNTLARVKYFMQASASLRSSPFKRSRFFVVNGTDTTTRKFISQR